MHIDRLQKRFTELYEDACNEKIEWERDYGEPYIVPSDQAFDDAENFATRLKGWSDKISTPMVESNKFGEITLSWDPTGMDCHIEASFKGDGNIGFEYHQKEGSDVLGGRLSVNDDIYLWSFCAIIRHVYCQLWEDNING